MFFDASPSLSYKVDLDPQDLNSFKNLYPHRLINNETTFYETKVSIRGLTAYHYIEKLKIAFPERISIRPLKYKEWKLLKPNQYDEENIRKILQLVVVETFPRKFPLFKTIKARPMLWSSLFNIIEKISKFSLVEEKDEIATAKRVNGYRDRYNSTLDGIYDIFVFENFRDKPEVWMHFRSLDYDERLDWLGFYQAVTGIDVWERVKEVRKGIVKSLSLLPKKPMPADVKARNETENRAVQEAKEKLKEDVIRDKMVGRKKIINTGAENADFHSLGD